MKAVGIVLILLLGSLTQPGLAQKDIQIDGLVVDQTISRVGHLFYEELISGWEPPEGFGTITIHERPDVFAGNVIWVEIDDNVAFQDRVGTRPAGIEEKAQAARGILEAYIRDKGEFMRDLEVY